MYTLGGVFERSFSNLVRGCDTIRYQIRATAGVMTMSRRSSVTALPFRKYTEASSQQKCRDRTASFIYSLGSRWWQLRAAVIGFSDHRDGGNARGHAAISEAFIRCTLPRASEACSHSVGHQMRPERHSDAMLRGPDISANGK